MVSVRSYFIRCVEKQNFEVGKHKTTKGTVLTGKDGKSPITMSTTFRNKFTVNSMYKKVRVVRVNK